MDGIAAIIRAASEFVRSNGIWEALIVLAIVAYILRDWWLSRNNRQINTGNADAIKSLTACNQTMTTLFTQQVGAIAKQAEATEKSVELLSEQNQILKDIKSDQQRTCQAKEYTCKAQIMSPDELARAIIRVQKLQEELRAQKESTNPPQVLNPAT